MFSISLLLLSMSLHLYKFDQMDTRMDVPKTIHEIKEQKQRGTIEKLIKYVLISFLKAVIPKCLFVILQHTQLVYKDKE